METLKEYYNILLGQRIKVYTDHKNLMHVNFNTQQVIRWRMVIEDFAPELIYIPGPNNVVADAISRLEQHDDKLDLHTFLLVEEYGMYAFAYYLANTKIQSQTNDDISEKHHTVELADLFAGDKLSDDIYPLNFKLIQKEQVRDT